MAILLLAIGVVALMIAVVKANSVNSHESGFAVMLIGGAGAICLVAGVIVALMV